MSALKNINIKNISIIAPSYISGDPSLNLGSIVSWSSNTYFNAWTSQTASASDLATSGGPGLAGYNTNQLCWAVFYAHKSIKLTADATSRWGYVPFQGGTNTVGLRYAVSSSNNTLGSFAADTYIASTLSNTYTAATFYPRVITTTTTIPANRYFMLGMVNGPYYRIFKSLSSNRTAVSNGQAVVTTLNRFYWGSWPSGPTTGIPTQLGGAATFTEVLGYVPLLSYKFDVV